MADPGQQVKYLQEQLRLAQTRAAEWQKRYEIEAQQRRQEAELSRQAFLSSKPAAHLLSISESEPLDPAIAEATATEIQAQVQAETDVARLQTQLIQALLENQQLSQSLAAERANHAKTRQSLTTALGDTIDTLQQRRRLRPPKTP